MYFVCEESNRRSKTGMKKQKVKKVQVFAYIVQGKDSLYFKSSIGPFVYIQPHVISLKLSVAW